QFGARDVNINTRSSTGILANSMLVLQNGRSLVQPFYGAVYWDLATVGTDELEQIAVYRSPSSALWGANALSGVVMLQGKSPRRLAFEDAGDIVSSDTSTETSRQRLSGWLATGTHGAESVHALWADARQGVSYKVSGSYFRQDAWDRDNT